MGRLFVRASTEFLTVAANPPFQQFPWGTLAAVIRVAGVGITQSIINIDFPASADDTMQYGVNPSNAVSLWLFTAGVSQSGGTVAVADGWMVVAMTKASGNVTPRAHIFKWSAQSWAHTNAGGAMNNDASVAQTQIFLGNDHVNESWNGDIAAVMCLPSRVLTDSEIERLPAGQWDRWLMQGDLLYEFKSGRDDPGGVVRDQARSRSRQTARAGTSRTAVADPPGFRFSRLTRRR